MRDLSIKIKFKIMEILIKNVQKITYRLFSSDNKDVLYNKEI